MKQFHRRLRRGYIALLAISLYSVLVRYITKHIEDGYKYLGPQMTFPILNLFCISYKAPITSKLREYLSELFPTHSQDL